MAYVHVHVRVRIIDAIGVSNIIINPSGPQHLVHIPSPQSVHVNWTRGKAVAVTRIGHWEERQNGGSQSQWAGTRERGGAVAVNHGTGGQALGREARRQQSLAGGKAAVTFNRHLVEGPGYWLGLD